MTGSPTPLPSSLPLVGTILLSFLGSFVIGGIFYLYSRYQKQQKIKKGKIIPDIDDISVPNTASINDESFMSNNTIAIAQMVPINSEPFRYDDDNEFGSLPDNIPSNSSPCISNTNTNSNNVQISFNIYANNSPSNSPDVANIVNSIDLNSILSKYQQIKNELEQGRSYSEQNNSEPTSYLDTQRRLLENRRNAAKLAPINSNDYQQNGDIQKKIKKDDRERRKGRKERAPKQRSQMVDMYKQYSSASNMQTTTTSNTTNIFTTSDNTSNIDISTSEVDIKEEINTDNETKNDRTKMRSKKRSQKTLSMYKRYADLALGNDSGLAAQPTNIGSNDKISTKDDDDDDDDVIDFN